MRTRRLRAVLAASLLAGAIGCAARDDFRLIHPPAARNDDFPGGYRLLTKAPLGDWQVVAEFSSKAACDHARRRAVEDEITRAHALVGDDAKNDLGVRRAVNARCVRRASRVSSHESRSTGPAPAVTRFPIARISFLTAQTSLP